MSNKLTTFEQFKMLGNKVKTFVDNQISNLAGLTSSGLTDLNSRIDSLHDIVLSGGVPYGKELTESWPALQARIKAGNFSGIHIGDFKTIQLTTGETVIMEVAGIDQYYRCGNPELGHHVDFVSRDCLANNPVGKYKFNDTNTNNGTAAEPNPWRASKLFQTMNNEATGIFSTLSADLKLCIIEKHGILEKRYSDAGTLNDSIGQSYYSMGKLWLPSEAEVFGRSIMSSALWATSGYGVNRQYPIFIGGSLHLIKGNGNGGARCDWREASARSNDLGHMCFVDASGNSTAYNADQRTVTVPLCFRIG